MTLTDEIINAMVHSESKAVNGKLTLQSIAETLNEGKPQNLHIPVKTIGYRLRQCGFEFTRTRDGRTAIFYKTSRMVDGVIRIIQFETGSRAQ